MSHITFPQNRKLFRSMLVCEWTVSLLLIWDVLIEVLHSSNNVPQTLKKSTTKSKTEGVAGKLQAQCPQHQVEERRLKKEGYRNVDQLSIKSRLCDHKRALFSGQSRAIITHSTVPLDRIERVISQRGEMTIYQRSSTPRLAPRTVLKSAWNEQQQQQKQQQQQVVLGSRGKLLAGHGPKGVRSTIQKEPRETAGGTLSEAPSSSNASPSVSSWSITGRRQQRRGADDSEKSKRKLREMDNIELYELVETVRKTQCPYCLEHSREGTIYCGCRKCLIPT